MVNPLVFARKLLERKLLLAAIIIICTVVAVSSFYSLQNSFRQKALSETKRVLSEQYLEASQVSGDLSSLFSLDTKDPLFNDRKDEIMTSIKEGKEELSFSDDLPSGIFTRTKTLEEIRNDYNTMHDDTDRYTSLLNDIYKNLSDYDALVSDLYRFEPSVTFDKAVSADTKDDYIQKAQVAKRNIKRISDSLSESKWNNEKVQSATQDASNVSAKFEAIENALNNRNFAHAQLELNDIKEGYEQLRSEVYLGMLGILTSDNAVKMFTLQNNILARYKNDIDKITAEQERI